jgi:hypothetical protein
LIFDSILVLNKILGIIANVIFPKFVVATSKITPLSQFFNNQVVARKYLKILSFILCDFLLFLSVYCKAEKIIYKNGVAKKSFKECCQISI